MTARSLHEIVSAVGPKKHRTGQPIRRSSYRIGMREGDFWSAFDRRERNARMRAAERYDREGKEPGKRNGPLGHIAIEVLREMMRIIDFRTGRLDPSIDYLAERLRRTRSAVHAALKRLRSHGFLDWIRRFAPREDAEPFGPQVRQISNAYRLTLPRSAAELVRRLLGRAPPPDDDVTRRREEEERVAAMLATLSAEELARFRAGDTALGRELARLGRAIDRNAIPPGGMNPALRG
ncbi:replication protein A [Sphingomonas phyllosphaerae]|uniref:replication protein A n=1 Tax=Sphingomonas phyllosphaerae TaxID=257003 RepID=UPI002413A838|nr:replication protein A [Sphingomonas phyllosphaerae]